MSEILRVKASDDVYKRIGQKFDDVKLENEKKRFGSQLYYHLLEPRWWSNHP